MDLNAVLRGNSARLRLAAIGAAAMALGFGAAAVAGAGGSDGIWVLQGSFGKAGSRQHMDISARLQDLCGSHGTSCEVFCANSTFGGRDPGRHGLCRVTYRCPDGSTRSAEAGRDDPLLLRCPAPEAEDSDTTARAAAR